MDDLDQIVARICASMESIGNTLLREAEEMRELRIETGKALDAMTANLAVVPNGEAQ